MNTSNDHRETARPITVVFDIDGTLATASSAHLDCLSAAAEAAFGVPTAFTMVGERPLLNGELVAGWIDAQCLRLLAEQAGSDYPALAATILADYTTRYATALADGRSPGTLIPGAADTLNTLAAAGVKMGLSTGNASGIAQAKLAALGIANHFTFAPDAGFGDHHSDRDAVAAAAVAALHNGHEGPAPRTLLVGDTTADMRAARNAGVAGIGVCTGAATPAELLGAGATAVLADVTELPGYLGLSAGATRWFPRPLPGSAYGAADRWQDNR